MQTRKHILSVRLCNDLICLLFVSVILPSFSSGQIDGPKGGEPNDFGVPTGAVFQFNESFLTQAIRSAWDANGLGSVRADFFLGSSSSGTEDNLDGYLTSEPLAIKPGKVAMEMIVEN